MMALPHKPVLLNEVKTVFKGLNGVLIDCTLGFGSHSYALLEENPNLKVIGIDQDDEALAYATDRLSVFGDRFMAQKGRFSEQCEKILKTQEVAGVLADIGISSYQLDQKQRGFGFDATCLDMRMDTSQPLSAKEVVNRYSKEELGRIFKEYGEVREYKKLASLICARRKDKPFESALELAEFINQHSSFRGAIHPATLPFQAIRIAVNEELQELAKLLEVTKGKTRILAIISFHSLEDRLIKNAFRDFSKDCICAKEALRCECGGGHALGKILNKKPIIPTEEEIKENRRSRSAKMRVFCFAKEGLEG